MADDGVAVAWSAAIWPETGGRLFAGRLNRVYGDRVVMAVDRDFPPGRCCTVVVKLPESGQDEAEQFIQGKGEVVFSGQSSVHFEITITWLELKGNGKALLDEYIMKYRQGSAG